MLTPFFGEFMGTLVLILLGEGVNAATTLKRSYAEAAGWMVVTAGWGFAVFCGVVTAIACGSPGAHLNPAVTLAVAIKTGDFSHVLSFIAAQLLGAFAGATLVWLFYFPHWGITEDPAAKRGVFCTGPAIHAPFWNLLSEVVGTAVLLLVIGCIGANETACPSSTCAFLLAGCGVQGPAPGLAPYLVGILVWSIGLSLGGATGYAINPARDFAPRLAHFLLPIAGKGDSGWSYAWVPVIGPILGAVAAGLFLRYTGI